MSIIQEDLKMSRNKSNSSKQSNSNYQTLYLWTSFLLGMISLGIVIWNRGKTSSVITINSNLIPVQVGIQSPFLDSEFMDSRFHGNDDVVLSLSTYQINFPRTASSLALGIAAYQLSGNSFIGLLSSSNLFFANKVSAQVPRTVVPEFQVNTNRAGFQGYAATTSLVSGDWVVVWFGTQKGKGYDIYAQRYAINGSALGSEFQVNTNMIGGQLSRVGVASLISGDLSGDWVVVWYGTEIYSAYAQRYANDGTALGAEFQLNMNLTGNQLVPAITSLPTGDWLVVWKTYRPGSAIYAQQFSINGTALHPEFEVSNSSYNPHPNVASLTSGGWVVVWEKGLNEIYAQLYAMDGRLLVPQFRVNSNTTLRQDSPVVTSLKSGEWLVAWEGNQIGNYNIYAQRFELNGSPVGSEFLINSNSVSSHSSPVMAGSLQSSDWVIAWWGNKAGTNDIYARCYASNGSALGNEFVVNSNPLIDDHRNPALIGLKSGEWAVVWQGGPTGTSDVYAAIFSCNGSSATTLLTSTPSAFSSSTVDTTASINNTIQTKSSTQQPISSTNDKSGTNGTVIGIAAGVAGVVSLGACAAAIGFYAYHKKSKVNKQSDNAILSEPSTMLQDKKSMQGGEYAQINLKNVDQSDNIIPSGNSNYVRVDEIKNPENQYDHAPKLEI